MAKRTTARKDAPEARDLGMKTQEGVLLKQRSRYLLKIGRTQKELPVGQFLDPADLDKLAGQEVLVGYSGDSIVVIVPRDPTKFPRFRCVLCYYPAPDLLRRIRPELRDALLNRYVKERIIPAPLAEEVRGVR